MLLSRLSKYLRMNVGHASILVILPLLTLTIVQCLPQEAVNALDQINTLRETQGIARLSLDRKLTAVAISRLPEVIGTYDHTGAWQYRDSTHPRVELLCRTPEKDAAGACVYGWQESLAHRNMMLNFYWTKAGIAAAKADDGWIYFVLFLE